MKTFFLLLCSFLFTITHAQTVLDHLEISLPDDLANWQYTKENSSTKEYFKKNSENQEYVKTWGQTKKEPFKMVEIFNYHPESNQEYITTVSFYIFENSNTKKTIKPFVAQFSQDNTTRFTDVKRVKKETNSSGKAIKHYQYYDVADTKLSKGKEFEIRKNIVEVLIEKKGYFIFIQAIEPIEPNYNAEIIYDPQLKIDLINTINNIRIN